MKDVTITIDGETHKLVYIYIPNQTVRTTAICVR